jgi:hypothetical protein
MDYSTSTMNTGAAAGAGIVVMIIYLVIVVLMIVSLWKIFVKAGKPGWGAIIPIYNLILYLEIVGKPLWWIILCLIPFVNIVILIILALELAKKFGKTVGFAIGLIILPIIFYPILGFGKATYTA